MILRAGADDVAYTDRVSGVAGNYLRESLVRAGLDGDAKISASGAALALPDGAKPKAWKDIWSAGHGVAAIHEVLSTAQLIDMLERQYLQAIQRVVPVPERAALTPP